jgi:hypothetical protein
MKIALLPASFLVTSIIALNSASAIDVSSLEFPEVKIGPTPSSLSELAREPRAPVPKPGFMRGVTSQNEEPKMTISSDEKFVIKPDASVDYKLLIKHPDGSVDYRLIVKNPDTLWKK